MPRLSLAFFATGALCALVGMVWGIQMASTENFTEAPAHAHLNLLGWASLAIMGGFYALAGDRAPRRLGWINYALSAAGVIVTIPSLALLLATGGKSNLGVVIGPFLVLGGMIAFLAAVIAVWRRPAVA
ncbi:MAG TPA: hypothetical protein VIC25_09600 [Caulobacteraceae bacterium]|jgi:hypothetical protein